MSFKPGHSKIGGRTRGAPNKLTADLRDMIFGALEEVGGRAYLVQQAKDNPATFMALLGKLVPRDVAMTLDDQRTPEEQRQRTEFVETLTRDLAILARYKARFGDLPGEPPA